VISRDFAWFVFPIATLSHCAFAPSPLCANFLLALNSKGSNRVLLIGWDSASWNVLNPALDAGELPALSRLVEDGVAGELLACQPLDSAALWTTIVTGKRLWQHGIPHSREFDPAQQRVIPVSRRPRRTRALWEMLAQHDRRSIVVGWPATHGSNSPRTSIVSDRYSEPTAPPGVKPWPPALPGTYWPPELGQSLDPLRVNPADIGADIIAHHVPQWNKIDQKQDRRLGQLRVLLTQDLSHFTAAMHLLRHSEWDLAAIHFPALAHLARIFLPLHPPRRPWITGRDFEIYQGVMLAEWRAFDHMLAALRQAAGPETTVLLASAHGTRTPDLPPAGFPQNDPHGWKLPHGLLAAAGPALLRDTLLHSAGILDIAPTILAILGLPLGEDMEGRVLVEAFQKFPEIQRIDSWDKDPAPATALAAAALPDHPAAKNLWQESEWNFVQSCLEAGRSKDALPHLQTLFQSAPERPDFCHALFQCHLTLGQLDAAQETLDVFVEIVPPGVAALLPQAELALARRDTNRARALVEEIRRLQPTHPLVLRRLGVLLLRLREWQTVATMAKAALTHSESDPLVWLALAAASLRLHQPAQAEEAARRAIQLRYFLPDAHFILTRALVAQNKWDAARDAMAALIKLQPDNRAAANYHRLMTRQAQTKANP
jgi:tetratricopeptide (TPR) repeat protein